MIIGLECSWHIAFAPGEIRLRLGRYRLLMFNWKFSYVKSKGLYQESKLTKVTD